MVDVAGYRFALRLRCIRLKGGSEVKRAPVAIAFQPNAATHHLDQAVRDGETQSGAAVFARHRAIRLPERLENNLLLVGFDSDTRVAYLEFRQQAAILHAPYGHVDADGT